MCLDATRFNAAGLDASGLADLVMARCDELAGCSEQPDRITRRFLSTPMLAVHQRLQGWMRRAKLVTRVDNVGNLIGRRASQSSAAKALLVGSHLDTVPGGGRYDGILGVLIGLAVAESLGQQELPFHLDIVGFSEEEGVRYNMPYLGSCAVAGLFSAEWLQRMDADGVSMREAITAFQLNPDEVNAAAYPPDSVLGYIEPHLEQGPVLERAGLPLGVVSGIAGQSRCRLAFVGEAAHAGTTPMRGRRDALAMAAEFICEVRTLGSQTPELRATVGRLEVLPNATNVIAGRAEVSLDVRHLSDAVRERVLDELLNAAARIAKTQQGRCVVLERLTQQAVEVDAGLRDLLTQSIQCSGHEVLHLPSGAGHDAVIMGQQFPMAMLFLRHPGGISHHPDERVERDDVVVAIEVLCQMVIRLAQHVQVMFCRSKQGEV